MRKAIGTLFFMSILTMVSAQKRFSEGTVVFEVQINNKEKNVQSSSLFTQLLKGAHYRDELSSSIGKSITIFDMREGTGAILKEYGGQKIMIPIVSDQWTSKLKKLATLEFKLVGEKKMILGYSCEKAEALSTDGTTHIVFYTKDLFPENQEMDIQFSQLSGFVLEYSSSKSNRTVLYSALSMNFDPVPIQKFDIPNSGYKILSYEESNKVGKN